MKTKNILLALTLLGSYAFGQVVTSKDFVTTLPPGSTREMMDNVPSAIDLTNNAVYVSGYIKNLSTGRDYILIKYDLNGNILWQVSYDHAGLEDRALAITVDALGNIYLTGASTSTTGFDIATIKYNLNGVLQWVSRFNGTSNLDDKGLSIAVDPTGNVFVGGFASNTGTGKDFTVIKYNALGVQQFAHTKNGTASLDDVANCLVWNNNKIYVTGNVKNTSTNEDIFTRKLDALTGAVNWSRTQNGTASLDDQSLDLKINGNYVLICGGITNTGTNQDYHFSKLSASTGSVVFSNSYDAFGGNDFASSLIYDASSNYAIVGLVQNGSNYDYHTVQYGMGGNFQNLNKHLTNSTATNILPKIAVDNLVNHYYVSGLTQNATLDGVIYQVTPGGNQGWIEYHNGAYGLNDSHVDLAVDNQGRVYVASLNQKANNIYDIALIRYSQTPVMFPIDMTGQSPNQHGAYTPNMGQLHDQNFTQVKDIQYYNTTISPAVFIKETQNSFQFLKSAHDTSKVDSIHRIDMSFIVKDGSGGTSIAKLYDFEPIAANQNFYTPNTGINGITDLKARRRLMVPNIYPNVDLHYYSNAYGIKYYFVVKPGGNPNSIFLSFNGAGSTFINGSNELVATAGFDNLKFKQPDVYQISSGMNVLPVGTASWSSNGGNGYGVTTPTYNPALPLVVMVSKPTAPLAVAQTTFWSTYVGSYGDDVALDVVTDNVGGVYVSGYTTDAVLYGANVGNLVVKGSQDALAIKFDKDANLKWTNIYGGSAQEEFRSLVFSNFNNNGAIYLTGYSTSNVTKCPIIPSPNPNDGTHWDNIAAGGSDAVIVKLNLSGGILYSQYIGGTETDKGTSIAKDDVLGRIYIVGNTSDGGGGNTNSWPFTNPGGTSYFTTMHGNTGSGFNDAFIFTLDMANFPKYSTFIGGDGDDIANEVAVDELGNGNIYLTGSTASSLSIRSSGYPYIALNDSKFPLGVWAGGYWQTTRAPSVTTSGYITMLNSQFNMNWSTLFNGDGNGAGTGVAVGQNGDLYATGFSYSTKSSTINCSVPTDDGFPSCQAFQTAAFGSFPSYADIYLAKFNYYHFMTYSTLYGNNDDENPSSTLGLGGHPKVCVEKNNNVFVTGCTRRDNSTSNAFPVQNKVGLYNQATNAGTLATLSTDAFILWFNSTNQRTWATHYGGGDPSAFASGDEVGNGVAIFGSTQLYMIGTATTYNLPLACPSSPGTPYCKNNNSNSYDSFLARFDMGVFIGIEESKLLTTENELTLYPNPTTNELNIGFKARELDNYSIEIYNVLGQLLYKKQIGRTFGLHTETIDISVFKGGMYIINLVSTKDVVSKKIIKQ